MSRGSRMAGPYRRVFLCSSCRTPVEHSTVVLSWNGAPLCDACLPTQEAPNVAAARRTVGGSLAARRGHLALAAHALGWSGASGATGIIVGMLFLVFGADAARRGRLLILSLGLVLMAASFVSIEDVALERWKHLLPSRQKRR